MSLVSKVGRKRPRARIALATLYTILIVGAATTLYPFLLMVSTGLKGPTDQNDNSIVPKFFSDKQELMTKYLADKYAGDESQIKSTRISGSTNSIPRYEEFLLQLPLDQWTVGFKQAPNQVTGRLNEKYQRWLRAKFASIEELNKAYIEENVAFQTVTPPSEAFERSTWKPTLGQKYTDWQSFKSTLGAEFRIPIRTTRLYQEFLKSKYKNRIDDVPKELNPESAPGFEQLKLPNPFPAVLKAEFHSKIPPRFVTGTAEEKYRSLTSEELPIGSFEEVQLTRNESTVRKEYASRNFRYVLDYILINGRAVWNTILFCTLAILTQLIVNPIAAYALSRYPIKASGKILLFLLATMAFPAEVAMIPSFLLLKDLGLLNTFAALILPGAASGYMIFLLKGFFDSLPPELYEAGQLDGAKETTLLMRIAVPLSRPVLGYLALMAFMASYSTFMFAFLVAQDQRMWTLMVWVYQLQTTAPKAVVMAALALAALPTLIVFLLAQRVIMRGIVLPGER
jgi:multiple sugar transport system permease protein